MILLVTHLFKFHYDSINSILPSTHSMIYDLFKFHYDSINSEQKKRTNAPS